MCLLKIFDCWKSQYSFFLIGKEELYFVIEIFMYFIYMFFVVFFKVEIVYGVNLMRLMRFLGW